VSGSASVSAHQIPRNLRDRSAPRKGADFGVAPGPGPIVAAAATLRIRSRFARKRSNNNKRHEFSSRERSRLIR
jgi:hypothetical protein